MSHHSAPAIPDRPRLRFAPSPTGSAARRRCADGAVQLAATRRSTIGGSLPPPRRGHRSSARSTDESTRAIFEGLELARARRGTRRSSTRARNLERHRRGRGTQLLANDTAYRCLLDTQAELEAERSPVEAESRGNEAIQVRSTLRCLLPADEIARRTSTPAFAVRAMRFKRARRRARRGIDLVHGIAFHVPEQATSRTSSSCRSDRDADLQPRGRVR